MQLQKQGKLEAFVRTWDRRYPHETEELFEWLRQSLTLVQVALGRLDFRKFIVRLSALSQGSGGGYLPHSELQQEFFCFDRESGCQRTAETMSASTTYSKFSLLASTHLSTYYCGFQ